MNEIEKFEFPVTGATVRVIQIDGEPWFVGREVIQILGYKNANEAVRDHVLPGQRRSERIATAGAVPFQEQVLINEQGLYRLVMKSQVPGALRFQAWVTDEVLPTIRKTGGAYIKPGSQAELDLTDPDTALDKLIEVATIAKQERAKRLAAEARAKELEAPAELAHRWYEGHKGAKYGLQDSAD